MIVKVYAKKSSTIPIMNLSKLKWKFTFKGCSNWFFQRLCCPLFVFLRIPNSGPVLVYKLCPIFHFEIFEIFLFEFIFVSELRLKKLIHQWEWRSMRKKVWIKLKLCKNTSAFLVWSCFQVQRNLSRVVPALGYLFL